MNKYFITGDLEKTLPGGLKNPPSGFISIDNRIRKKMMNILDLSFQSKGVVEFISYDSIYNFFESLRRPEEFILGLEDGIYIENADFYFSSTRAYENANEILLSSKSYSIIQRNGNPLSQQNETLLSKIKLSGKSEIIICDDGLFSGDTLKSVIYDLESYGIKVKEIRVILNFTNIDNLNGIPIVSMYSPTDFIDWIDERDFFYGTKNSGASFWYNKKLNGLPYISSKEIASKKASIPEISGYKFLEDMKGLNIEVWTFLQETSNIVVNLGDLQRIEYLQDRFSKDMNIVDVIGEL